MSEKLLDLRCFCKACEDRTKETYQLEASCSNCGWKGIAVLRKGDRHGVMVDCPHCGTPRVNFGSDPKFSKSGDVTHDTP
jgi:hypothetical protein